MMLIIVLFFHERFDHAMFLKKEMLYYLVTAEFYLTNHSLCVHFA